jgi:hypothetical protein
MLTRTSYGAAMQIERQLMTTLEEAKQFARKMRRQMTILRRKALVNTDKSLDLHHEYMQKVIEFFGGLKKMGFRTTDWDEPGKPGRVVPITKEWIAEQRRKETKVQKLARKYRRNPDPKLLREITLAMNEELNMDQA